MKDKVFTSDVSEAADPIGGAWLLRKYELPLVQPLFVQSSIGPRRMTVQDATLSVRQIYTEQMRPLDNVIDHLSFLLKHEEVHLEFLQRLFSVMYPDLLAAWVRAEPTGQYARRSGFLYEWLTGKKLTLDDGLTGGNYVDALDPSKVLTAVKAIPNKRWRVRDNMPGTPSFCPTVRLTQNVQIALEFDYGQALKDEEIEFGADMLRRCAVWLTLRESRSSFQIEGEVDQAKRIQRFAAVMETRTGSGPLPLSESALATLQQEILGAAHSISKYGLRQSPVFVGQASLSQQVVHYVAPHWSTVPSMLEGLAEFERRTIGASAIARAGVAAFSFVYIHPLADGNGRIHRFLVNDVLRRDGLIPAPFILPISASITETVAGRSGYDAALEQFSKPLMARFSSSCEFTREKTTEADGISTNFHFSAYKVAEAAWRYPDLTNQVQYTADLVRWTIQEEMHTQALYLRQNDEARAAVKERFEGPNPDIDAIIRSCKQNAGVLSGKLVKQFPGLMLPGVWEHIVQSVRDVFEPENDTDDDLPSGPHKG